MAYGPPVSVKLGPYFLGGPEWPPSARWGNRNGEIWASAATAGVGEALAFNYVMSPSKLLQPANSTRRRPIFHVDRGEDSQARVSIWPCVWRRAGHCWTGARATNRLR